MLADVIRKRRCDTHKPDFASSSRSYSESINIKTKQTRYTYGERHSSRLHTETRDIAFNGSLP
jgi:hypothetical protein